MPFSTLSDDNIPWMYYAHTNKPGVYLHWDRNNVSNVASYEILRAEVFDGEYLPIVVLEWPANEYVDEDGHPHFYYKIREIASDDSVISTSQPIIGEELLIKASLAYQINDFMHVHINNEEVIFNKDRTVGRVAYTNWSYLPKAEIRITGATSNGNGDPFVILSENDLITKTTNEVSDNYTNGLKYKLDYQGRIYFINEDDEPEPIKVYDNIDVSYDVRLFTGTQMNDALNLALQTINSQPGSNKYPRVIDAPFYYDGALVTGATYYLLRALLTGLNQREKRLLIMDPDNGAFNSLQELRETAKMYKDDFDVLLKALPKSRFPVIGSIVTPEYFLPGGRGRLYRYAWKGV